MNKILAFGCILVTTLIVGSCGGSVEPPSLTSDQHTEAYSYEFCFNCSTGTGMDMRCATTCSTGGCTTGKHQTASKDEHCSQLRDDSANHFCAEDTRRRTFQSAGCTGSF